MKYIPAAIKSPSVQFKNNTKARQDQALPASLICQPERMPVNLMWQNRLQTSAIGIWNLVEVASMSHHNQGRISSCGGSDALGVS